MPDTYQETIRLRVEVDSSDVGKAVQSEQQRANQRLRQQASSPSPNIPRGNPLNWDTMRGVFGATNTAASFMGMGRNIFGIPQYQMMSMSRMFGGMGNPSQSHYQSIRASEINRMAREAVKSRSQSQTIPAITEETKKFFEKIKGGMSEAIAKVTASTVTGSFATRLGANDDIKAATKAYNNIAESMGYAISGVKSNLSYKKDYIAFEGSTVASARQKPQKFGKSDEDKAAIEEEKKKLISEEIKKKAEADKKIAEQAAKAAATGAKFVGAIEVSASVAVQLGQVLKSISSALSNFAASFATGDVSKAMHGVVDALQGIAHGIGAGTSAIVGSIGRAIGSTFGPIGTMVGAAAGALVGNILGGALSKVAGVFHTFIDMMDSLTSNLSKWNPTLAAANAQLNVNTIIFQRQMSYAMQPAILAWLNLKEIILDKLISYAPQINQLANYIADLIGYLGELINAIVPLTKLFVQMVHLVWDTLIRPVLKLSVALMEIINPVIWLIGNFHILGDVIKLFSDGLTNGLIKLLEVFAMIAEKLNFHTIAKDLFDAAADIKKGADATLTAAELQKQAAEWGKAFINSLRDFATAHGSGGKDTTRKLGASLFGLVGAPGGAIAGNGSSVQQALNNATGQIMAGNTMNQAANTVAQAANVMAGAAKTTATAADIALAASKISNPAGATAAQIAAANFLAQGHGKYNVDFGQSSQNQYSAGISGGVDISNIPSHQWFNNKIYKTPWSTAFGSRNRLKYPGYMPYNQWADIVGASQGTGLGRYPDTGSTLGAMGSRYGSNGMYSDSGNAFGAMGEKYGGSDLSSGFMSFQQWRLRKLQRAGNKNLHGQNIDDPDYSGVDPNLVWAYKLRAMVGLDKTNVQPQLPSSGSVSGNTGTPILPPTTQPSTPSQAFIQSIGGKVTPAPSGQLDRYGRSPDDPDYLSAFKTDPQKDTDSWKKARNITTDSERALAEYKKDIHKTGPSIPHAAVALNAQFNNTFNQTIEEQEVNRAIWQVREFLLNTFNCHRNETQLWLATLEGSMIADSV